MELLSEWELVDTDDRFREHAACKGADKDIFFPEGSPRAAFKRAAAICTGCQVRRDCLRFALNNQIMYGVWGGLSPKERAKKGEEVLASLGQPK